MLAKNSISRNDIHDESVDNVASKTPNNMRRAEVKRCIVFLVYPSEEVTSMKKI
jgi:hypothetical protein